MRKNIDQKYFESFSNELVSKFGRINHLIRSARGAIGNYHEELVKSAIENFLSSRYSIKTGYIFFDEENISNQIDILIIDENYSFAYLFQEGDFVIVKPEAVVCAIEVKSRLNKESLEKSITNVSRAKEIKLLTKSGGIMGLIFGYDSPVTSNGWLEKCFLSEKIKSLKDKDDLWPNGVFFLNKAELLFFDAGGRQDKKKRKCYYRLYKDTDLEKEEHFRVNQSHKLAMFIAWILGSLAGNETFASGRFVDNNFSQLIDGTNQKVGFDGFRIAKKTVQRDPV